MITSTKNPIIKKIRKLRTTRKARIETGQFIIEGLRMAEEALQAGFMPDVLLYREHLNPRTEQVLNGFRDLGLEPIPVTAQVMHKASGTVSPQDIIAIMPVQPLPLPKNPGFVLLLDRLHDPGNMGTILRTAAAAGVDAVLLSPTGADPYNDKVVRAGMGAHFRVPLHQLSWEEIRQAVTPLQVYVAEAKGSILYTEVDMTAPLAIVIGGEAFGPSPEAERLNPMPIHIPMPGGSESLNAGIAAGILIYETVRQRNLKSQLTTQKS